MYFTYNWFYVNTLKMTYTLTDYTFFFKEGDREIKNVEGR